MKKLGFEFWEKKNSDRHTANRHISCSCFLMFFNVLQCVLMFSVFFNVFLSVVSSVFLSGLHCVPPMLSTVFPNVLPGRVCLWRWWWPTMCNTMGHRFVCSATSGVQPSTPKWYLLHWTQITHAFSDLLAPALRDHRLCASDGHLNCGFRRFQLATFSLNERLLRLKFT